MCSVVINLWSVWQKVRQNGLVACSGTPAKRGKSDSVHCASLCIIYQSILAVHCLLHPVGQVVAPHVPFIDTLMYDGDRCLAWGDIPRAFLIDRSGARRRQARACGWRTRAPIDQVAVIVCYDSVPLRRLIACQIGALRCLWRWGCFAGDGNMETDLQQFHVLLKEGMWREVMGKNWWDYVWWEIVCLEQRISGNVGRELNGCGKEVNMEVVEMAENDCNHGKEVMNYLGVWI